MEVIYSGSDQNFDFGDGKGTQREGCGRDTLLCGIRTYFDQTRGQRNVMPDWDWERDEPRVRRCQVARIATPRCAVMRTTGGAAAGVEEWCWRQHPQCILDVVSFLPLEKKGIMTALFPLLLLVNHLCVFPDLFRQQSLMKKPSFLFESQAGRPKQLSFVLGEAAIKFHRARRNCRVCSSFLPATLLTVTLISLTWDRIKWLILAALTQLPSVFPVRDPNKVLLFLLSR